MTVAKTAVGVTLGLIGAAALTRLMDEVFSDRTHGVHITMASLVPLGALALGGGLVGGSVARGAMYGMTAGTILAAAFTSTFTFGSGPGPGYFGKEHPFALDPPRASLPPNPTTPTFTR